MLVFDVTWMALMLRMDSVGHESVFHSKGQTKSREPHKTRKSRRGSFIWSNNRKTKIKGFIRTYRLLHHEEWGFGIKNLILSFLFKNKSGGLSQVDGHVDDGMVTRVRWMELGRGAYNSTWLRMTEWDKYNTKGSWRRSYRGGGMDRKWRRLKS